MAHTIASAVALTLLTLARSGLYDLTYQDARSIVDVDVVLGQQRTPHQHRAFAAPMRYLTIAMTLVPLVVLMRSLLGARTSYLPAGLPSANLAPVT